MKERVLGVQETWPHSISLRRRGKPSPRCSRRASQSARVRLTIQLRYDCLQFLQQMRFEKSGEPLTIPRAEGRQDEFVFLDGLPPSLHRQICEVTASSRAARKRMVHRNERRIS